MDLVFHIGYHKTATSWLQQSYFREHPGIALLSNSEQPWADPLLSYLIAASDAEYDQNVGRALLEERVRTSDVVGRKILLISAERLSGHPYSGGYDNVRIARRIATTFVDAKILCVVRNQIDMIWSVYKQLVSAGFPGKLSHLIAMRSWKTTAFDPAYFEYDRLMSQYHALFGKERVCVLQYELMRSDIGAFLRRLCDFMGVDYVEPRQAALRVNPSLSDASIGMVRKLNYFGKSELYPLPMLDLGRGYYPLRDMAVRIAQHTPWLAPRSDMQLPRELVQRFCESNARLARMLGDEFIEYPLLR